ncbi:hypothetical protein BGZ63DRAFT_377564 [Mariannaea sp. PMI_226]|nr:hypothetical protein BGZ63DRAFT_377564 [Mariannaea sp. PMI_226]
MCLYIRYSFCCVNVPAFQQMPHIAHAKSSICICQTCARTGNQQCSTGSHVVHWPHATYVAARKQEGSKRGVVMRNVLQGRFSRAPWRQGLSSLCRSHAALRAIRVQAKNGKRFVSIEGCDGSSQVNGGALVVGLTSALQGRVICPHRCTTYWALKKAFGRSP